MVDRWAEIRSKTCSSTCGQIDACCGGPAAEPEVSISVLARSAMSSTGTTTLRSHCLVNLGWTTVTGRSPPRKRATSSTGRTVADRPIRCAGWGSSASSLSRVRARCAPRLVPATACTSSTITVSTPRKDSRPCEVSSRKSDSGVVISTSDGFVANRRRSLAACVTRAHRDLDVDRCLAEPPRGLPDPDQWSAQVALDVDRQRLQR